MRFAGICDAVSKEQRGLWIGGIKHSRNEGGGGGVVQGSLFGLGGKYPRVGELCRGRGGEEGGGGITYIELECDLVRC